MWQAFLSDEFRLQIWPGLAEAARTRLERFAADLLRENRARNLISRREPERLLAALLEESVNAARILERRGFAGRRWADVGTGAGFPGLVLGALLPEQPLTLIERRSGRCDFLRREQRALGLTTVEVLEVDVRQYVGTPFDLVLAKAVAPPGQIERLCARVVAESGTLAVFGRSGDEPGRGWSQAWSEPLPGPGSVLRGLVRSGLFHVEPSPGEVQPR